jgi:Flp pilus assembly protein TadB
MAARRRKSARRQTRRKSTARRASPRKRRRASTTRATTVATASSGSTSKNHDLAAMYLSILIVGVAGIILLVARPTAMMQKVIGILLVVLGLWGLMMKK